MKTNEDCFFSAVYDDFEMCDVKMMDIWVFCVVGNEMNTYGEKLELFLSWV